MNESSLVLLTKADLLLSQADTIQKTKELKDKFLTLMDWAKRMRAGQETIKKIQGYTLEAERKMGIMLKSVNMPVNQYDRQNPNLRELGITKDESSQSQKIASIPESKFNEIKTQSKAEILRNIKKESNLNMRKKRELEEIKDKAKTIPVIIKSNCMDIIEKIEPIDLLIADPPYFTDGDFTEHISAYLKKVKPTGQAYVFMSSDPLEVKAYLSINTHHMKLEQILIWCYNNTGQRQPNARYTSNYQVYFYYRGPKAQNIIKPSDGKEQYACQTVNAPDGRIGDRYHEWQKPEDLIARLIKNSSNEMDFIFDPFAGTGTTLISAGKLGRIARGCDIDNKAIKICKDRGCNELE